MRPMVSGKAVRFTRAARLMAARSSGVRQTWTRPSLTSLQGEGL